MSYRETIQEMLSDGQWHCVLGLIAETGLSARNRISEINKDSIIVSGSAAIEGKECSLEKCNHKSSLFMYRRIDIDEQQKYEEKFDNMMGQLFVT